MAQTGKTWTVFNTCIDSDEESVLWKLQVQLKIPERELRQRIKDGTAKLQVAYLSKVKSCVLEQSWG